MTYQDAVIEWKVLSSLFEPQNIDWMRRLTPAIFTGERVNVFNGMLDAYSEDIGEITIEGLNYALKGNIPGELLAAKPTKLQPAIRELARLAKKRQAKARAKKLDTLADEFDPDLETLQSTALFEPILAAEDSSITIGARNLLTDLAKKQSGVYKFAKSGLQFIDNSLGGEWKPQSLVIYAGGPGTGKTTLAAQSMIQMARGYINTQTGEKIITPSLFLSLEMTKADLMVKWVGSTLHINTQLIQNGKLTEEQVQQIENEIEVIQQLPMYVIDKADLTMSQMIYEIRKHVTNYDVRVVFIDYLQIVNHHPTGNDNNDLGDFADQMKKLAKALDITIVIFSQITPGKDGVFKIRDSGEVGAHADVVFQGMLDNDEPGPIKSVNIDRLKNRFGSTGRTVLLFNAPYQYFEEATS